MEHIKQKTLGISSKQDEVYTVVITDGYTDLSLHPSIIEHPDLFEIVDQDIPEDHQLLNYTG